MERQRKTGGMTEERDGEREEDYRWIFRLSLRPLARLAKTERSRYAGTGHETGGTLNFFIVVATGHGKRKQN